MFVVSSADSVTSASSSSVTTSVLFSSSFLILSVSETSTITVVGQRKRTRQPKISKGANWFNSGGGGNVGISVTGALEMKEYRGLST